MFEGKHIQVGAGRYIQCHGALKRAGEEMVFFGKKAYLLYGDQMVKGKTSQVLEKSLRGSGITFQSEIFEGPSTEKSFGDVAARVRESGAEIVAGIGGGRIIDIAKAAGDMADVSIFTIPTSAATCAAYAVLYVVYGEDGNVDHSGFLNHEISGGIVDMDLVVNDCPRRYFGSVIVDAMAKKPEFSFTMSHLKDEGMIATSEIATKIADFTYSKYMRDTRQALRDFDDKKDSMLLDDMVNMNIMLTGMVSDLSTGGKQLAVAHNFYDAICCMHKDVRKKYLHGEIVAMALPLQLAVNGSPEAEIEEFYGHDYAAMEGLLAGADGWMSGFPAVLPKQCRRLQDACFAKDVDAAIAAQNNIQPYIDYFFYDKVNGVPHWQEICKYTLQAQGLDVGLPRKPLGELDDANKKKIEKLLADME